MNPMAMLTGGLAGLLGAVGILSVISALRRRRPTLMARLEPYVHRRPTTSSLLAAPAGPTSDGSTVVGLLMASTARALSLGRLMDTLGSSADSVRRRLTRSGSSLGVDQFRLQQVLWSTTALLLVLTAGGLAALARSVNVPALILLCLMGTVAGAAARDWWLSRAVAKRLSRIEAQLPDVVELLALAVGAGQGPVPAIERIVALGRGDLVDELRSTLTDIRSGPVLSTSLACARRSSWPLSVAHHWRTFCAPRPPTCVRRRARTSWRRVEDGRSPKWSPWSSSSCPSPSSSPSSRDCSFSGWGCETPSPPSGTCRAQSAFVLLPRIPTDSKEQS